ncbi:hypothetical protein DIURU_001257 [Diutina rugosa]|uniref:Vacuolar protein sorting-associated protein 54 C-terminal domain-containing protein n=1 Tax=Diutina rugosa TaxID=5481 RepID=A0A642UVF0_DIURU|nr:uncharacterized protein DIURU_001257 [Diutina rugosa]KAA8906075.1 hypothetical protein DIURU_001257 [Diutina rugosa]
MTSPHASVVLNDDLDETASSVASHQTAAVPRPRFSLDDDSFSTYLGSGDQPLSSTVSPLGPNSIFELTVGSDQARVRNKRGLKHSVVINGGATTVYNLTTPTSRDIPQIHLAKLKHKVNDEKVKPLLASMDDYREFESSYGRLTSDTLHEFARRTQPTNSSDESLSEQENNTATNLSKIPSVFLDPDFRMDDPRVFSKVLENTKILTTDDEDITTSLAHNTDLQEKFSSYLDIVEQNLVLEIGKSSDSFFTTLDDITKIQNQSKECVAQFAQLKDELVKVQTTQAERGKQICSDLIKNKNVEYLESALLHIKYITTFYEMAVREYSQQNFSRCLDLIVIVESLVNGVEYDDFDNDPELLSLYPRFDYPIENVSKLPCLINLVNDVHNLKHECARGFTSEFVDILIDDLRNHYTSVPINDTLNRLYCAMNPRKYPSSAVKSYLVMDEEIKDKLKNCVFSLIKSGQITHGYRVYQDKLIAEIKSIIKQNLPSGPGSGVSPMPSNAPSSRNSPVPHAVAEQSSLSVNIKSLTPKEFEEMLVKTYSNLSECLRRSTTHQKILLDLALSLGGTSQNLDVMSLDITSAINKAIELTQIRLTKIINVRSESIGDLPVPMYLRLYSISSSYLQECESIDPMGSGTHLAEWFKNHLTYFVHRNHSRSLKTLVSNIDHDTWKEASAEELTVGQFNLDQISSYADWVQTGGRNGNSCDFWLDALDFYTGPERKALQGPKPISSGKLTIGSESFVVPTFIIKSLAQVRDYLTIHKMFPNVPITNNVLNYFKLANSRISQAILNAGATKTAGLKHITTRHIALCIQTVEFVMALLPRVEQALPPPTSQLNQGPRPDSDLNFGRIYTSYKDHENELFNKLVSIMRDRTMLHCQVILKTNWSEPMPYGTQCHPYMETIVKETNRVSKVLAKVLPELKCSHILSQVFDNYKKLLVSCYCAELPQLKDMMEKQMVLKDIDFFRVNLCDLPGYGNSGQVIWENVNALPTLEDSTLEQQRKLEEERLKQQELARQEQERIEREKAELEARKAEEAKRAEEEATSQAAETLFDAQLAGKLSEDTPHEESKKDSVDLLPKEAAANDTVILSKESSMAPEELKPDAVIESTSDLSDTLPSLDAKEGDKTATSLENPALMSKDSGEDTTSALVEDRDSKKDTTDDANKPQTTVLQQASPEDTVAFEETVPSDKAVDLEDNASPEHTIPSKDAVSEVEASVEEVEPVETIFEIPETKVDSPEVAVSQDGSSQGVADNSVSGTSVSAEVDQDKLTEEGLSEVSKVDEQSLPTIEVEETAAVAESSAAAPTNDENVEQSITSDTPTVSSTSQEVQHPNVNEVNESNPASESTTPSNDNAAGSVSTNEKSAPESIELPEVEAQEGGEKTKDVEVSAAEVEVESPEVESPEVEEAEPEAPSIASSGSNGATQNSTNKKKKKKKKKGKK